jgi:hypothetical protein
MSKRDSKIITANVVSDVASILSNSAALVSCKAEAYAFLVDSLSDGDFLNNKSMANPMEEMPHFRTLKRIEDPSCHILKYRKDAYHAKWFRKKHMALSWPGSKEDLRISRKSPRLCTVLSKEMMALLAICTSREFGRDGSFRCFLGARDDLAFRITTKPKSLWVRPVQATSLSTIRSSANVSRREVDEVL